MTYQAYQNLYSSAGKESACKAGDPGSILRPGRYPGKGKCYPHQYSGLENSMDCNSPWGHKESDTTEPLSLSLLSKSVLVIKKSMSLLVVWPLVITFSGSYLYTQLTVQ